MKVTTASRFDVLAALVAGLGALAPAPALAQSLDDRYWLEVSAYWAGIDTRLQASLVAQPTIGTKINGEDDLGLDEREALPKLRAGARLGGGWIVNAEYFLLHRDTTNTLARDIIFEDVTYPASVSVTTGFDTDIYRFTLGYAFIRNPDVEIGAAIGVHATNVEASIEGEGRVGNAAAQLTRRSEEFLAPLPTVGLFGSYRVAPRLTLGGRIDWLELSWGDYDGRLVNAEASLTYRPWRNLGLGAGWRLVDYRVGVEKERYTGRFAYQFSGPTLFLQLGF